MAGTYDINYYPSAPSMGAQNPTGAYLQQAQSPAAMGSSSLAPAAGYQAPGMGGAASPLGFNMGTANLALGGIGTIGNLWAAFQAQKLAREQFDFQKGITNTNLANQIQSYNTTLTDRINTRAQIQGNDQGYIDRYLSDNALRDERKA